MRHAMTYPNVAFIPLHSLSAPHSMPSSPDFCSLRPRPLSQCNPVMWRRRRCWRRLQQDRQQEQQQQLVTMRVSDNNNNDGAKTIRQQQQQPPRVKSSFYKNPSKAIEKGGGFYIPGLRGPRLRFFVSAVTASLLALNHLFSTFPSSSSSSSSGRSIGESLITTTTNTLHTSELLAAFAAFCVFASAVYDILAASTSTSTPSSQDSTTDINTATMSNSTKADTPSVYSNNAMTSTNSPQQVQQQWQQDDSDGAGSWALETCVDLTTATHVAVFQDGALTLATENIKGAQNNTQSCVPGSVVDRVIQEQKSVFVSNSAELPPHVTLPFLPEGQQWSVFVVPVDEQSAVTYAKQNDSSVGFAMEDRRWLEAFASRLVE